jgi:hypothetical protein
MNGSERTRFSRVLFPDDMDPGSSEQLEVFVNGVKQVPVTDYELGDDGVYFFRPIRKEAKLSRFRWLVLFIGLVGSYKQNDSVDIVCRVEGRLKHHVNLPIEVLVEPTDEQKGLLVGSYSPGG